MRDQPPIPDADQEFLDALLERAIEQLEQNRPLSVDALLGENIRLRARAEGVIRLAREVAVGRNATLPTVPGYSILTEIGQGGMGAVYLARQERVAGRLVALKILPAGSALSHRARERFVRETEAIARLRHPNVITIFDVVHSGGVLAYAMEWIDGVSLADAIAQAATEPARRGGSLSIPDICHIGIAIARALAAVHAAGLLHRDVKPSNILLRRAPGAPGAVLTDFGLAREADSAVTQPGHFAGTPAYAPPEQLRGDPAPSPSGRGQGEGRRGEGRRRVRTSGPPDTNSIPRGAREHPRSPNSGDTGKGNGGVDARSDVYSLGVTLYHALSGRVPFEGDRPGKLLSSIESGRYSPLRLINPQLPRDLETIIATAMDADPARRYQTAEALADDLERLLSLRPIKARPAGLATRTLKLARRNRRSLAAAVIGATIALAVGMAALVYAFLLPRWAAGHLRNARLALLDPGKANNIVSTLYWGRTNPFSAEQRAAQAQALAPALASYDKALRWSMHDPQIQHERDIVARARDDLENSLVRESLLAPIQAGIPSCAGKPRHARGKGIPTDVRARKDSRTSEQYSDPRSRGLYAYLIHDIETAIKSWEEYEQSRNPIAQPDPLVDGALGVLYLFDDQAARAYPRLQKAVEAFPGVGFLMEYLADAATKCGDAGRARRWLEESKHLPRRDHMGAAERIHAGVLAAEGRADEAIAAYRSAVPTGLPQVELAALLTRAGRLDEALDEYARLPAGLRDAPRVEASFRRCAEKWWAAQPKAGRLRRIRATLEDGSDSILPLLRQYRASLSQDRPESRRLTEIERRPNALSIAIFNPELAVITALGGLFFSPSLQGLSLNELAERMEVENMALWSRINSSSRFLKTLWLASSFSSAFSRSYSVFRFTTDSLRDMLNSRSRMSVPRLSAGAFALAALASIPAAQGQTYVLYNSSSGDLPTAQGWQNVGMAPAIENGLLHIGPTTPQDPGSYSVRNDLNFNFNTGVRIECDSEVVSSGCAQAQSGFPRYGFGFSAVDSLGRYVVVWICSGTVVLANTPFEAVNGINVKIASYQVTGAPRQYELICWPSGFALNIDGAAVLDIPLGSSIGAPNGTQVWFGDGTEAANADCNVYVSRFRIGGPIPDCTTPPCFQGLGDLPGGIYESSAGGISAVPLSSDGSTVVGSSMSADGMQAFRWNPQTGMFGLGDLPGNGFSSFARAVNSNGFNVGGGSNSINSSGNPPYEAFSWNSSSGMMGLGVPASFSATYMNAMSDDGNVQVGGEPAWYRIGAGPILPLPSTGGVFWNAYAVSRSGSHAVGGNFTGAEWTAVRWTIAGGFDTLGDLPGGSTNARAWAVSGDGAIVVGYGTSAAGIEAFRWTQATGMVALGDLAGGATSSSASAISADGSIIVGDGTDENGPRAVAWVDSASAEPVSNLLAGKGVSIPTGWVLTNASGVTINNDVVTLCGNGINPQGNTEAWIARYTLPPACDAAHVIQSPSPAAVPFGGTVQLSVVAAGTGPLAYQWRKDGVNLTDGPVGCGGAISGATTDTLVLNTVTFVEAGDYDCVVTNACGNDASAVATLTINPPPAAADVNHDGQVNGADIQALVNALLAP